MPKARKSWSCSMCGHDVAGRPPEDVKLEKRCFPCSAGMLEIRLGKAMKERNKLWDALSNILEEPALAIPPKLRKAGLRAIATCQKAEFAERRK